MGTGMGVDSEAPTEFRSYRMTGWYRPRYENAITNVQHWSLVVVAPNPDAAMRKIRALPGVSGSTLFTDVVELVEE